MCRSEISIHALREEGDFLQLFPGAQTITISIHALREEGDTGKYRYLTFEDRFQSTPSARRATREAWLEKTMEEISIHALREEGDETKVHGFVGKA